VKAVNDESVLVRAAWLYYIEDLTQQEVADRLHLSRVKVTRLLKQARDTGIVEFHIARPTAHLELEGHLCRSFGLSDAFVVPTEESGEGLRRSLGKAGATFLQDAIRPGLRIGLGMGRTLAQIPPFLEFESRNDGCVFQEMVGGAGRTDLGFDTYNVSWRLAQACGGGARHVFAPVITETAEIRQSLMQDPQVLTPLQEAAESDVAVIGIGDVSDDMLLLQLGYCDEGQIDELRQRGAVGDILGHFFDINGQPVRCAVDDRLIALGIEQVRALPTTIAVAGGLEKTEAILGALRTGCLDVLVTDSRTATAVVQRNAALEGSERQAA
jgi:DNA-binding transcriptional regulator LsrR (DeoR family)